jgi:hypothetical protein
MQSALCVQTVEAAQTVFARPHGTPQKPSLLQVSPTPQSGEQVSSGPHGGTTVLGLQVMVAA